MNTKRIIITLIFIAMIIAAIAWFLSNPKPALSNHATTPQIDKKQILESTESPLPNDAIITRLVVFKSQRKMLAYHNDTLLKTYDISLGFQPIGHKHFEGDGKTPEGIYTINNRNPNSSYHKNLGISYPNQQDIQYAQSQGKSAGGDVKIHGLRNGFGVIGRKHLLRDWTHGCIAVTNEEVDELYRSVVANAEIDIRP